MGVASLKPFEDREAKGVTSDRERKERGDLNERLGLVWNGLYEEVGAEDMGPEAAERNRDRL